jgi:hypothetical protein
MEQNNLLENKEMNLNEKYYKDKSVVFELTEKIYNINALKTFSKIKYHLAKSSDSIIDLQQVKNCKYLFKEVNKDNGKSLKVYSKVSYDIGRYYPKDNISIAGIDGKIRRCLIDGQAFELDLENSHINLLCDIIDDYDINKKSNKLQLPMQEYKNNRDSYLEQIQAEYGVNRKQAKELFLILSYGGTFTTWKKECNLSKSIKSNNFIKDFQNSIKDIIHYISEEQTGNNFYKNILQLFQKIKPSVQKERQQYSSLAVMLQDLETKISYEIMEILKKDNIEVNVFLHDGIYIDNSNNEKINDEYIDKIQKHIFNKFKFNIKLKKKSVVRSVEDNIWFKKIEKLVDNTEEYKLIETDKEASDYILDEYLNEQIYICDNVYYIKENFIWRSIAKIAYLKIILGRLISNIDIRIENDNGDVKPYSQTCNGNNKIIDIVIKNIPEKRDLIKLFLSTTKKKLCFKNGVYCFINKKFFKWNDYNDVIYTLNVIDRNYNENVSQETINNIDNKIWKQMFYNEDISYVKMCYSRAIAGMVSDKRWYVQIGQRNCGKSKLVNFFENSFGDDYIGITNANNFLTDNTSNDEAKKNMWLMDIWNKRIVFSNEFKIDKNVCVDGNKFKSICSGGSDKVELRINHADPVKLKPQLTLMMNLNDLPEIKPADAKSNMILISLPNQFVQKDEFDETDTNLKLADEGIDEFIENEENLDALIYDIIHSFVDERPSITENIINSTNEYKDDTKEIDFFYEHYTFSSSINDTISVNDLNKLLQNELHLSPQKIFALLKKNNDNVKKIKKCNKKYYYTHIKTNNYYNLDENDEM